MERNTVHYAVGSERNPGDPFGRSSLVIEIDGNARLDQYTRAGETSWTGKVQKSALDDFWLALEVAGFPSFPVHHVPAGSAIRDLTVGGPTLESVHIAHHAAESMPGYVVAFRILDTVIRQLSEDTVKVVPDGAPVMVSSVRRLSAEERRALMPQVSPGTAYLLGFLPARRRAHQAKTAFVEQWSAAGAPALARALVSARRTLKEEEPKVDETGDRFAALAIAHEVEWPLDAEYMRSRLGTDVQQASWRAGEVAGRVLVAIERAVQVASLRAAAPDHPELRALAEERAAELRASAEQLTAALVATRLPLVISQAGNVAEMVRLTHDLTPVTPGGLRQLSELARDLQRFIQIKVRELDAAPPPVVSEGPSAEERALEARILATPSDLGLRLELAALAERRGDDRAKLIRLQLTSIDDDATRQAMDLIRSHPEWSAPLEELGARDVQFRGGFPDTVTVDAAVLLERGAELFRAAPLRGLRVRAARGRTGEIVRSPLLATIESLDLDDQAVSDEDLIALAASPHVTRLRQLDLRHEPVSARGIEALAASRQLRALLVVNLDGNPDDPVDRLEYYDETHQHAVPTEAGKALEAKYGPVRWLRRS